MPDYVFNLEALPPGEYKATISILKDGRKEIAVVTKTQPDAKWISVVERLPETRSSILGQKSNKVIVAFRFDDGTQGTDTAHTLNGDWVFEDRIVVVNRTVTHWMPLPEPPKEMEVES